jgi:hypothetical protein
MRGRPFDVVWRSRQRRINPNAFDPNVVLGRPHSFARENHQLRVAYAIVKNGRQRSTSTQND